MIEWLGLIGLMIVLIGVMWLMVRTNRDGDKRS